MCILLKLEYPKFGVSNLFFFKSYWRKTLGKIGSTPPPPLGKEKSFCTTKITNQITITTFCKVKITNQIKITGFASISPMQLQTNLCHFEISPATVGGGVGLDPQNKATVNGLTWNLPLIIVQMILVNMQNLRLLSFLLLEIWRLKNSFSRMEQVIVFCQHSAKMSNR